jgi:Skp family chaperone for outer membrane proteins
MRLLHPLAALGALLLCAPAAFAAPKIAVVDMVTLMEKHPETMKLEQQAKQAQKEATDALRAAEQKLEDLRKEIQALNQENPRARNLQKQYESERMWAKFNHEWAITSAMQEYVKGLENTYAAILAEVKRYAEANGIELVLLRTDPQKPMNASDLQEFGVKSRLKVVLYAQASLDITAAIQATFEKK